MSGFLNACQFEDKQIKDKEVTTVHMCCHIIAEFTRCTGVTQIRNSPGCIPTLFLMHIHRHSNKYLMVTF